MPSWDLFLAHASADKARVRPLVAALRALGLRVFFDEDSVPLGAEWDLFIPVAQRQSRGTVACTSAAYVAAFYERAEVHDAIRLKRQGNHLLIPVHLDGAPGADNVFYGLTIVQGLVMPEIGVVEAARRIGEALGAAPAGGSSVPPSTPPALEPVLPAVLHKALCRLTDLSFDTLVLELGIERAQLLPRTVALGARAMNLIEHMGERDGDDARLVETLRRMRPGMV